MEWNNSFVEPADMSTAVVTIANTTTTLLPVIPHRVLLPLSLQDNINLTAFISAHHHRWNVTPYQYPFFFFSNDSLPFPPCPSIQMPMGNFISMVLYTFVCIIGLLGNTLVIYVVLRFSKMQTVTNIYILNLAFADESFLIGIPFLLTTMHLGEWTFGSTMCKAYMVSTSITQFTSSIFLFIMSADRYLGKWFRISRQIANRHVHLFCLRVMNTNCTISILPWLMSPAHKLQHDSLNPLLHRQPNSKIMYIFSWFVTYNKAFK